MNSCLTLISNILNVLNDDRHIKSVFSPMSCSGSNLKSPVSTDTYLFMFGRANRVPDLRFNLLGFFENFPDIAIWP